MTEIKTRVGNLYIEDATEREEPDRIKLYDSRKAYLDYLPTDGFSTEDVAALAMKTSTEIKKLRRVDELMDYLGIDSYTVSKNWEDLLEDIYGIDGYEYDAESGIWHTVPDGNEITKATVLQNEFVCVIGDELVLICE